MTNKLNTHGLLAMGLAMGVFGFAAAVRADSGAWTNLLGGNWEIAGNWADGTIADGADNTASLTGINVTADRTVTVDAGRTIGHLRFGDTVKTLQYGEGWILAGSTLTLDVSAGQPTIRSNIDRSDTGYVTINAALAGDDGLRLDAGTWIRLNGASSYTGYTTISGLTAIVANNLAFGTSSLSLTKGALWAPTDYTLANDVSLDGDFFFGYASGSSYPGDLKFTKKLMLNGNYALIHHGSSGGGYPQPTTFNAGVDDGGMGYVLTIKNGTYNNDAFQLGGGSTYTNMTVIHGSTLRLVGTLDTTARVVVNRGGNLQAHGLRDATGFNNTRLADSIPVVLRSGTLSIYASYSNLKDQDKETFGTVTHDYGHSIIEASGGRCITRLTITNLVRDTGTFFFNRYGQMLNGSGGRIFLTGQPAGFMGGWSYAKGADYPNTTEYDFSWYDATAGVLPMLANVARPDQVEGATAVDHVKTTSAQTTLSVPTSLASLCVTNSLYNNLGGFALDIVSGGLLNRAGVYVMSNGALTSSGGKLYLYNLGTAMTNSASITGAGVSVTTVGNQTLAGNNSFGGKLHVNADTLTLTGTNTGISEAVVVPGAQLSLMNTGALPVTLTLSLLYDGEEYGKLNNPYANVVIQALVLDGVNQLAGTYGATGSGCQYTNNNYFAGSGTLLVPEQPRGTLIMLK